MVAIVETKLGEDETVELDGYKILKQNRNEDGGGIMITVHQNLEHITVVVDQKREPGETTWLTISNGRINIRFGVACTTGK